MRKITVISMITLDGVMQSPGSPQEDPSNGFTYGGWIVPYGDEVDAKFIEKFMEPADLLLGRKTFQIWEDYWPKHAQGWPGINEMKKYVFSTTLKSSEWTNCIFLETLEEIKDLKSSVGSDIRVWGSSRLIQLLLKNDLVDELCLIIHPITLGEGKKLFNEGPIPAAFQLNESAVTAKGVILAKYGRGGEVRTGTVGE